MKDTIITPLGTTINRKKYERQNRFRNRANQEFRDYVNKMYKHNFSLKKENAVILKFPFCDMFGHPIIGYQIDSKNIIKTGKMYWLYKQLKVRLE